MSQRASEQGPKGRGRTRLPRLLRENLPEWVALGNSALALGISLRTIQQDVGQHSDQLTATMIREAYTDFISLHSLRAAFPLQNHLFEVPSTYDEVKGQVYRATDVFPAERRQAELCRLLLEERALARRTFSMFEHAFYQWRHAQDSRDRDREAFMKAVVDYFTGRLLRNPRLLWYWMEEGGNLCVHYEDDTRAHYTSQVPIEADSLSVDALGPFGIALRDSVPQAGE